MEIHKEFLKAISLTSYSQIYLVWGFYNKMEVRKKLESLLNHFGREISPLCVNQKKGNYCSETKYSKETSRNVKKCRSFLFCLLHYQMNYYEEEINWNKDYDALFEYHIHIYYIYMYIYYIYIYILQFSKAVIWKYHYMGIPNLAKLLV